MNLNKLYFALLGLASLLLSGCAVKPAITNQYKLSNYSTTPLSKHSTHQSILINPPEAVAGYQTSQMLYTDKPFEISAFAHNGWLNPPADMLLPLITQSLQRTGYFYAVSSTSNSEQTDYRLDTQLIELQQNFLVKPSRMDFVVKVVLTRVSDDHVIASQLLSYHLPCPADTPYGGVIAANQAVKMFTGDVSSFIVKHVSLEPRQQA